MHPLSGTSSRVLLPVTLHPIVIRRRHNASSGPGGGGGGQAPPEHGLTAAVVLRYCLSRGVSSMHDQLHRCMAALAELPSCVTLLGGSGHVVYQNTASIKYMGLRQGTTCGGGGEHAALPPPPPRVMAALVAAAGGGDAHSALPPYLTAQAYDEGGPESWSGSAPQPRGPAKSDWASAPSPACMALAAAIGRGPKGAGEAPGVLECGLLSELFAQSPQQMSEVVAEVTAGRSWKGIVRVHTLLARPGAAPPSSAGAGAPWLLWDGTEPGAAAVARQQGPVVLEVGGSWEADALPDGCPATAGVARPPSGWAAPVSGPGTPAAAGQYDAGCRPGGGGVGDGAGAVACRSALSATSGTSPYVAGVAPRVPSVVGGMRGMSLTAAAAAMGVTFSEAPLPRFGRPIAHSPLQFGHGGMHALGHMSPHSRGGADGPAMPALPELAAYSVASTSGEAPGRSQVTSPHVVNGPSRNSLAFGEALFAAGNMSMASAVSFEGGGFVPVTSETDGDATDAAAAAAVRPGPATPVHCRTADVAYDNAFRSGITAPVPSTVAGELASSYVEGTGSLGSARPLGWTGTPLPLPLPAQSNDGGTGGMRAYSVGATASGAPGVICEGPFTGEANSATARAMAADASRLGMYVTAPARQARNAYAALFDAFSSNGPGMIAGGGSIASVTSGNVFGRKSLTIQTSTGMTASGGTSTARPLTARQSVELRRTALGLGKGGGAEVSNPLSTSTWGLVADAGRGGRANVKRNTSFGAAVLRAGQPLPPGPLNRDVPCSTPSVGTPYPRFGTGPGMLSSPNTAGAGSRAHALLTELATGTSSNQGAGSSRQSTDGWPANAGRGGAVARPGGAGGVSFSAAMPRGGASGAAGGGGAPGPLYKTRSDAAVLVANARAAAANGVGVVSVSGGGGGGGSTPPMQRRPTAAASQSNLAAGGGLPCFASEGTPKGARGGGGGGGMAELYGSRDFMFVDTDGTQSSMEPPSPQIAHLEISIHPNPPPASGGPGTPSSAAPPPSPALSPLAPIPSVTDLPCSPTFTPADQRVLGPIAAAVAAPSHALGMDSPTAHRSGTQGAVTLSGFLGPGYRGGAYTVGDRDAGNTCGTNTATNTVTSLNSNARASLESRGVRGAAPGGGEGGAGTCDGEGADGGEEGEGEEAFAWHEVTVSPVADPASAEGPLLLVMQTDVTARVRAERAIAEVLEAEHALLESIFPRHVLEAAAAARQGENRAAGAAKYRLAQLPLAANSASVATYHPMVTILFADIVGFTSLCHEIPATRVMEFLNRLYSRLDTLLDVYGVYKVETIGDCYMVSGGLMARDADGLMSVRASDAVDELHAAKTLAFAKAMLREAAQVRLPTSGKPVEMRIGLHSGPVMSGIVGSKMPRFCLFGDTVNTASRMESTCRPGNIHVSQATKALLPDEPWEATGGVQVKGIGLMKTYRWSPGEAELIALTAGLTDPAGKRGGPGARTRRASAVVIVSANLHAASASSAIVTGPGGASDGKAGGMAAALNNVSSVAMQLTAALGSGRGGFTPLPSPMPMPTPTPGLAAALPGSIDLSSMLTALGGAPATGGHELSGGSTAAAGSGGGASGGNGGGGGGAGGLQRGESGLVAIPSSELGSLWQRSALAGGLLNRSGRRNTFRRSTTVHSDTLQDTLSGMSAPTRKQLMDEAMIARVNGSSNGKPANTDGEASTCEAPASVGEAPVSVGEAPVSVGEAPVSVGEAPTECESVLAVDVERQLQEALEAGVLQGVPEASTTQEEAVTAEAAAAAVADGAAAPVATSTEA
ncbi:hypothetical protein HYH03_005979 [Edaphochlamys debaryana]|uniref:Guanylate cyclase domain-containing protein n=1 Tax=Edaphochlamys debaryana TaxID=47281 RepID=A0A836C0T3_9CHLO|nr:hypothetical protein HYH03_005979 [Edaphochlamys debaryana]|eukprot:KAG2496060.1 hypothetical protein HYH03_005979 [Edaphochlamys debaryana]